MKLCMSYGLCHDYVSLPLQCESSQIIHEQVWLSANKLYLQKQAWAVGAGSWFRCWAGSVYHSRHCGYCPNTLILPASSFTSLFQGHSTSLATAMVHASLITVYFWLWEKGGSETQLTSPLQTSVVCEWFQPGMAFLQCEESQDGTKPTHGKQS